MFNSFDFEISSKGLATLINASGGMVKSSTGVGVKLADASLTVDSTGIRQTFYVAGTTLPLSVDANHKLNFGFNTSDFTTTNNVLNVKTGAGITVVAPVSKDANGAINLDYDTGVFQTTLSKLDINLATINPCLSKTGGLAVKSDGISIVSTSGSLAISATYKQTLQDLQSSCTTSKESCTSSKGLCTTSQDSCTASKTSCTTSSESCAASKTSTKADAVATKADAVATAADVVC